MVLKVLFCLLFCSLSVICQRSVYPNYRPKGNPPSADTRIEERLVRLEGNIDKVLAEIKISNSRLETLNDGLYFSERNINDLKMTIEKYFTEDNQRLHKIGEATANLVTNSRNLKQEMAEIRRNVTNISQITRNMLSMNNDKVTQSVNNRGLDLDRLVNPSPSCSHNTCQSSSNNGSSVKPLPRNCLEVLELGLGNSSGIYMIYPDRDHRDSVTNSSIGPFPAKCEMNTVSSGGGWTVVQNRYDGSQDFFRSWIEYKHGFGNIGGEFWIGLDRLHSLTGYEVNELLIEMESFGDMDPAAPLPEDDLPTTNYAHYGFFSVGSEHELYPLNLLGDYNGGAGDSLMYHAGSRFSTFDVDMDKWLDGSCAKAHGGGWWYNNCDSANLNGPYVRGILPESRRYVGMYWDGFGGSLNSLKSVRMMVRPKRNTQISSTPQYYKKAKRTYPKVDEFDIY